MQGNQWNVKLNVFGTHSLFTGLIDELVDSLTVTYRVLNKEMPATDIKKLH